jgi:methionine-gamma-lyase
MVSSIRWHKSVADHLANPNSPVSLAVDNTYRAALVTPIAHVDLVVYSATKFIGGHGDVIAGALLGNTLLKRMKVMRTFLGNMASPHTCWLLLRSLKPSKCEWSGKLAVMHKRLLMY